jgi:hypothetical protein
VPPGGEVVDEKSANLCGAHGWNIRRHEWKTG